jgi:hypothetical protein
MWIEKLFSFYTDRMITLTEGEKKLTDHHPTDLQDNSDGRLLIYFQV